MSVDDRHCPSLLVHSTSQAEAKIKVTLAPIKNSIWILNKCCSTESCIVKLSKYVVLNASYVAGWWIIYFTGCCPCIYAPWASWQIKLIMSSHGKCVPARVTQSLKVRGLSSHKPFELPSRKAHPSHSDTYLTLPRPLGSFIFDLHGTWEIHTHGPARHQETVWLSNNILLFSQCAIFLVRTQCCHRRRRTNNDPFQPCIVRWSHIVSWRCSAERACTLKEYYLPCSRVMDYETNTN